MFVPGALPPGSRLPQGGVLHGFVTDESPAYFGRRLRARKPPAKSHSFAKDMMRCPICAGRLQVVALKSDRLKYRRRSNMPHH